MRILVAGTLAVLMSLAASAQQFELVEPEGNVTGWVEIKRTRLQILESTGERIEYSREQRYDSTNGRFLGYFNFELNRVLRLPRSGTGVMFTADLDDAAPRFRRTVRTIRPRQEREAVPVPRRGGYADDLPPLPGDRVTGGHFLEPPIPGYGGGYERWVPPVGPPRSLSQSLLIDSQVISGPPLSPVVVRLLNSGSRDLQVALIPLDADLADQSIRLAPGESRPVELRRDSGGQRVDFYRVINPLGETFTKEIATPIPPQPLYEVVVHEWAMQSVAIDRTGKSPNVIEDINFQGRGLGRFALPAGPALTSTTIDVRQAARAAGNPGAVAPLVPEEAGAERLPDEPLDRAVREALEQQRRAVQRGR